MISSNVLGPMGRMVRAIWAMAVLKATELFKDELLAKASAVMEVPADELTYMDDALCHTTSDRFLSPAQLLCQLRQRQLAVGEEAVG